MTSSRKDRIVITGMGPLSSNGIGKSDFWGGLLSKKVNIQNVKKIIEGEEWGFYSKHVIKNFNINKFNLEEQYIDDLRSWKKKDDIDLWYLLAAAKLAIEDSGIVYERFSNDIGIVVTHENPGLEQYFHSTLENTYNYFLKNNKNNKKIKKINFFKDVTKILMKSSFELQTFMPVFHLAKILGIHGYPLFINNACASGAFALEEASQIIRSGKSSAVIVVAADHPDIYKFLWFNDLKNYSKQGKMCPFSKNADGFLMGEGGAALILESLESAEQRSANIYGEYLGGGFVSEAWKVAVPDVSRQMYQAAIEKALDNACLKPEEINLIVPHGIATPLSDQYEARTIDRVFKNRFSHLKACALKPYFGHNLGGNVLIEVASILLMMKNKCLLPTLNLGEQIGEFKIEFSESAEEKDIKLALKITCGFAGFYSAIILGEYEKNK